MTSRLIYAYSIPDRSPRHNGQLGDLDARKAASLFAGQVTRYALRGKLPVTVHPAGVLPSQVPPDDSVACVGALWVAVPAARFARPPTAQHRRLLGEPICRGGLRLNRWQPSPEAIIVPVPTPRFPPRTYRHAWSRRRPVAQPTPQVCLSWMSNTTFGCKGLWGEQAKFEHSLATAQTRLADALSSDSQR